MNIKTRFAPSPTGYLHVGGLRTALFNYLLARKLGGSFLLRIEDTDQAREVKGAAEKLQEVLQQFQLTWDEGPHYQSKRLEIYREHAEQLIKSGAAYRCFCSPERLEELRKIAEAQKVPFRYDKHCLHNPNQKADKFVIRQNVPEEGSTEFSDEVYGHISIENKTLEDGILIKSDGYPTYNFANVVDDHLMGITHVLRGEEFIPSTPKHILLYKAFGWTSPSFAHLPLILDKQRKKLSKRSGDVAVEEYVGKGYLPEALLNFVALLGWNPKTEKEIFSLEELIEEFALEKINKAGAIFDTDKLDYINREWQKKIGGDRNPLYKLAKEKLSDKFGSIDEKFFARIWPLVTERISGPSELEERLPEFYFFFENPEYEARLLIWKESSSEQIRKNLEKTRSFLEKTENFEASSLEREMKEFIAQEGIKTGEILWPLRVALTGLQKSPGPFEILSSFAAKSDGKEIIFRRIDTALAKLQKI